MALYQHSLTFLAEVIFGNISKITHIQHFPTTSFRNGSISNILRKLDSPSKINTWTHVDVWQDLDSFWSKTHFKVKKTHSPAGLDRVLMCIKFSVFFSPIFGGKFPHGFLRGEKILKIFSTGKNFPHQFHWGNFIYVFFVLEHFFYCKTSKDRLKTLKTFLGGLRPPNPHMW